MQSACCACARRCRSERAHPVHVVVLPPVGAAGVQLLPHVQAALLARPRNSVVQEKRHYQRHRRARREDGIEDVCTKVTLRQILKKSLIVMMITAMNE
jgi:hypothetical protein